MTKSEKPFPNYGYGGTRLPYIYDFTNPLECVTKIVDYMLIRTQQMFKYDGLPETIPQMFLEKFLQRNGQCGIIKTDEGDLYAVIGTIGGFPDPYYMPTKYVVANPALKITKTYTIDEDVVLFRNDSEMQGLIPLFSKYATLMHTAETSMSVELINIRIPSIAVAGSDNRKVAFDKYMEEIIKGKPGICIGADFEEAFRTTPYSSTDSKVTDIIESWQYIKGSWFNELGIKAPFNMKREAISASEASLSDDLLVPLVDNMFQHRQIGVDKINKMFGTNITVRYNSTWSEMFEERKAELDKLNAEIEQIETESITELENGGEADESSEIREDK